MTKKHYNEVKILLHDDLRYPYLGRDERGYVLHLVKPKRLNNNSVLFQGLRFNLQNPAHRKFMWYIFKASVYHLSLHTLFSDLTVYSKWARGKQLNLAAFVISLIEDAVIDKILKMEFNWMLPETVYANVVSYIRMKRAEELSNDISRAMTSILLNYNLGKVKGELKNDVQTDVEAITAMLQKIGEKPTADEKIGYANKIYDALSLYGQAFEVPSLLHMESHGTNDMFYNEQTPDEKEIQALFTEALHTARAGFNGRTYIENEGEAHRALTSWLERENAQLKVLRAYMDAGRNTQFEDITFPTEDYSEYQRRKELLGGPVRRILHQLRLLKNISGEDFKQESGFVDLQEAIQVIASKSQRTDIFVREELQTREDAWSILIDASHSLNMFKGEVRGIAICLAEVARLLILNQNSWGMYAFNNKFYIIKDFTERYDAHVKARIGGLTHGGFTYLPDAITLAAQALKGRLEEARVLVVVSDFFPSGYDDAEEKLKEALKKVERMGVGVIGIGVNSSAVKRYVRINCVAESPYDLIKKFTRAFIEFSAS
ncbi:MAG: VWA domain-containing protein [Candidatus Bathyarchaeota archaeon]|nr:VWA domain-containing protein [Candidatus Bathyarchaeota archaeon]MDW8040694.1 vWA domain-containing protein [Nitrososphaerota archaeon]